MHDRALEIELDELDSFVKLLPKLTPATKAAIPRNRWSLVLKWEGEAENLNIYFSQHSVYGCASSIRFDRLLSGCLSAP